MGEGNQAGDIIAALREMKLLAPGERYEIAPLAGGVSCEVYRVTTDGRSICVKRALGRLRVEADWRAPAERSHTEVEWISLVARLDPGLVPQILGEDRSRHLFVMPYYPPDHYPVWKSQLAAGNVDLAFTARLATALARIHAATAGRAEIACQFDNDGQFLALRLDPYLLHTARQHPDLAVRIRGIVNGIARARIALMHGDFSPKNILCGPDGPMILDAETACFGDPAFDLAFCLNHLALKCVWHPGRSKGYLAAFDVFRRTYLAGVNWEAPVSLDRRAAPLLAALMLARIDGKSPVEYITDARDRDFVRGSARALLQTADSLDTFAQRWRAQLDSRPRSGGTQK